ncbi:MAG TPA: helix-hairpin-helix domain-containing protein [Aggregatilineaceae bacterium]|mgnify:FL=1|jgi:predicted DNA-binding helix-hairpin-helix protein|nr:helix-hairpin-helix domain-containing protein [Aggregatilineaceae bacterium]
MDGHDLLSALHGTTEFESVGDAPRQEQPVRSRRVPPDLSGCITNVTAGSRKMPVLKAMSTTACERDCFYCPFRAGRSSMKRVKFTPDEMASGFMALYRAGAVEGLFLSSGIVRGGVTSQDAILDTGAILRQKHGFRGYMHLKLMPGAQRDQVREAMRLATRVSINLEAPNAARLERIAPGKLFEQELVTPLRWVDEMRQDPDSRLRASSTTELVVGPAGESDLELLSVTDVLYRQLHLSRVYYSAFRPLVETPLADVPATDPQRQLRLYQASFLLRDYGFELEELPFAGQGDLPLAVDPKRAWADQSLAHQPVEINYAARAELLRVPGIGPQGADRILKARARGRLRTLDDLRAIGIRGVKRVAPYVLLDGRRPLDQPRLF